MKEIKQKKKPKKLVLSMSHVTVTLLTEHVLLWRTASHSSVPVIGKKKKEIK